MSNICSKVLEKAKEAWEFGNKVMEGVVNKDRDKVFKAAAGGLEVAAFFVKRSNLNDNIKQGFTSSHEAFTVARTVFSLANTGAGVIRKTVSNIGTIYSIVTKINEDGEVIGKSKSNFGLHSSAHGYQGKSEKILGFFIEGCNIITGASYFTAFGPLRATQFFSGKFGAKELNLKCRQGFLWSMGVLQFFTLIGTGLDLFHEAKVFSRYKDDIANRRVSSKAGYRPLPGDAGVYPPGVILDDVKSQFVMVVVDAFFVFCEKGTEFAKSIVVLGKIKHNDYVMVGFNGAIGIFSLILAIVRSVNNIRTEKRVSDVGKARTKYLSELPV